ncbi:MAG: YraN family protein [Elusimicrobiota bacterium]
MKSDNVSKGRRGEDLAVKYLKNKDYYILDRNWRCPVGELDIVARNNSYLCFIEVKYRKSDNYGLPREAVNRSKKNKIVKLAKLYIANSGLDGMDVRFDVIEVTDQKIEHIRNAFQEN